MYVLPPSPEDLQRLYHEYDHTFSFDDFHVHFLLDHMFYVLLLSYRSVVRPSEINMDDHNDNDMLTIIYIFFILAILIFIYFSSLCPARGRLSLMTLFTLLTLLTLTFGFLTFCYLSLLIFTFQTVLIFLGSI